MSTLLANNNPLLPDALWLEGILIIGKMERQTNNSPVMLYLWGLIKNYFNENKTLLSKMRKRIVM